MTPCTRISSGEKCICFTSTYKVSVFDSIFANPTSFYLLTLRRVLVRTASPTMIKLYKFHKSYVLSTDNLNSNEPSDNSTRFSKRITTDTTSSKYKKHTLPK